MLIVMALAAAAGSVVLAGSALAAERSRIEALRPVRRTAT